MTFATSQPGMGVTITTTLYGAVSPERYAKEVALAKHRVNQLSYTRPAPRERRFVSAEERAMMRAIEEQ